MNDPQRPETGRERSIVIIPTYNEADNILAVIEQVAALPDRVDVLVVDDGSPDTTAKRVRSAVDRYGDQVHLIERSGKLGLGTAYILGFRYALDNGYTYICEMDADLSHNPADLARLIEPVRLDQRFNIGEVAHPVAPQA